MVNGIGKRVGWVGMGAGDLLAVEVGDLALDSIISYISSVVMRWGDGETGRRGHGEMGRYATSRNRQEMEICIEFGCFWPLGMEIGAKGAKEEEKQREHQSFFLSSFLSFPFLFH